MVGAPGGTVTFVDEAGASSAKAGSLTAVVVAVNATTAVTAMAARRDGCIGLLGRMVEAHCALLASQMLPHIDCSSDVHPRGNELRSPSSRGTWFGRVGRHHLGMHVRDGGLSIPRPRVGAADTLGK